MLNCSYCGSNDVVLQCGNECGKATYCSELCGKLHFPLHKIACPVGSAHGWEIIKENTKERKLLFETVHMSGYALHIKPLEEISTEIHPDATQFFLVVQGSGSYKIKDAEEDIQEHSMFYVAPNTPHSIRANGEGLKLLTLYAPASHHTEK
jgi:mannose-6-phosphate isomerase-like protein (cupin superfamily)